MPDRQEAARVEPVPCIVCGKDLKAVMDKFPTQNQPLGATVFTARGQYGSTAWDPPGLFHSPFLEINVCDSCLVERQDRVLLVSVNPSPDQYNYVPWPEAQYEDHRPPTLEELNAE